MNNPEHLCIYIFDHICVCVRVRVRVRAWAWACAWAWASACACAWGCGGVGVWEPNPFGKDCLASMFKTIPSPVRRGYVVCNLLNPNSVFLPLPIFAPPSRESAFLHQPAKAAARSCSEPGVVFDNVLDCLLWVVLCISCGLLRCLDCASTPSVSELRTEMHCAI